MAEFSVGDRVEYTNGFLGEVGDTGIIQDSAANTSEVLVLKDRTGAKEWKARTNIKLVGLKPGDKVIFLEDYIGVFKAGGIYTLEASGCFSGEKGDFAEGFGGTLGSCGLDRCYRLATEQEIKEHEAKKAEPTLKMGDRVLFLGPSYDSFNEVGATGLVVEFMGDDIGVEWDEGTDSSAGFHSCGGTALSGRGYYVPPRMLELIEAKEVFNLKKETQTIMSSATNLVNANLTADERYLRTNSLKNTDGTVTSYGRDALMQFLFTKNEADLVKALKAADKAVRAARKADAAELETTPE